MSSEAARQVRQQGHKDAEYFASILGNEAKIFIDPQAKKDVDFHGFGFSVKSGQKKWQIFLYSLSRLENDTIFQGIDGLGNLLADCLKVFPERFEDYRQNKDTYKKQLAVKMRELRAKLEDKRVLKAFLEKSIFNGEEVRFLAIKVEDIFHVFENSDVVNKLSELIRVENSKARTFGQYDAQKVVFKVGGKTIGEIEVRTDSNIHYRELKFWLSKNEIFRILKLCFSVLGSFQEGKVILYGKQDNKHMKNLKKFLRT